MFLLTIREISEGGQPGDSPATRAKLSVEGTSGPLPVAPIIDQGLIGTGPDKFPGLAVVKGEESLVAIGGDEGGKIKKGGDAPERPANSFKVKTAEELAAVLKKAKEGDAPLPIVVYAPTPVCKDDICEMKKLDKSVPEKYSQHAVFLELPQGGLGGDVPKGDLADINNLFKKEHPTQLELHAFKYDKGQQKMVPLKAVRYRDDETYVKALLKLDEHVID